MKFKIALLALTFFTTQSFSQSKNNISALYGVAGSDVNIHNAIGDYGYHKKTGTLFGLSYTRQVTRVLSIETGLLFTDDKVELSSIQGPLGEVISDGRVKLVSVPVYLKFSFLKYFYASAGLLADKQTNYSSQSVVNDQSGIGSELNVGARFSLGKATVFISPYLRSCGLTSFSGGSNNNNLNDAGVKFGVGLNF